MKPAIIIGIIMGVMALGILVNLAGRQSGSSIVQLDLVGEQANRGFEVARSRGCIACHSLDGRPGIGPTWLGMYGRTETLVDGTSIIVDQDYIRESIVYPAAKLVAEFDNVMIPYALTPDEMDAIIEFTRQLGNR